MLRRTCLILLIISTVVSLYPAAPAQHRPEAAKVNLQKPASAADDLNQSFMSMYLSIEKNAPEANELGFMIGELNQNLKQLRQLDDEIKKFGNGISDTQLKQKALRQRAFAWLHAWACYSQLVTKAAEGKTERDRHTEILIALKDNNADSTLALLLTVYHQMIDAEMKADPLRAYLMNTDDFARSLGYRKPWGDLKPKDFPESHRYYLPSTHDILGESHDDTKPNPLGLLSLWGIVNLQLDTWRGDEQNLKPLGDWIFDLTTHGYAKLFYQANGDRGQATSNRIGKLSRYVLARHDLQQPKKLANVLKELKDDRAADKKCGNSTVLNLEQAATPAGGESLPAAEIWLRYVFMLSFRGEESPHIAKNAEKYWKTCELPAQFDQSLRQERKETKGFARWNQNPSEWHYDRALYDATRSAYGFLTWESEIPTLEKGRLETILGKGNKDYVTQLKNHVEKIKNLNVLHLAKYHATQPSYYLASLNANPFVNDTVHSQPWLGHYTPAQEKQLQNDLVQIAAQTNGMTDLYDSVLKAAEANQNQMPIALASLSSHYGGMEWNVLAMPTLSYDKYYKNIEEALKDLAAQVDKEQQESDFKDKYLNRRDEAIISEFYYASAKIGVEIAERGVKLGKAMEKVAKIRVAIAALDKEAAILNQQAAAGNKDATTKRVQLSRTARDLAAAQVDAIVEAQVNAEAMVKKAIDELNALRPKLEEVAKKIEESKKSSFLSILRAIIKVIAVALAPFTGGISLNIGEAANQALNIIEKAGQINWNNPLEALAQAADIINDVGKLGDMTIGKWGGENTKKMWSDVKSYVKKPQEWVGQQKEKLSEEAHKFMSHIQKLGDKEYQQIVGQLTAAINLDLPITFDPQNGKINIDLDKAGIKINDTKLENTLANLLKNGGAVANSIENKVGKWSSLLGLKDKLNDEETKEFKKNLSNAINDLVETLPPEMVKDVANAKKAVDNAKQDLIDYANNTTDQGRRLLAQVLTGQMVVVIDVNGHVVAVKRAIDKEIEATKGRLKAYKESVVRTVKSDLTKLISDKNKELEQAANRAQEAKDETTLRAIAKDGVNNKIAEIQDQLTKLAGELAIARGELQDAETKLEVDVNLDKVAQLLNDAGKSKVQSEELKTQVASIEQEVSMQQRELFESTLEQKKIELQAMERKVLSTRAALQRSYSDCLRWGYDPLSERHIKQNDEKPSLADTLRIPERRVDQEGMNPPTLRLAQLHRVAVNLVGMLQWLRLVGQVADNKVSINTTVVKQYIRIVQVLEDGNTVIKSSELLRAVAKETNEMMEKVKNSDQLPRPYWVEDDALLDGMTVEWLTKGLKDGERDIQFADLPASLRHRAVGRIRLMVDSNAPKNQVAFAKFEATTDRNTGYYALPEHTNLLSKFVNPGDREDLVYIVLPPPNRRSSAFDFPIHVKHQAKLTNGDKPKSVLKDKIDAIALNRVTENLGIWNGAVHIVPAVGEWRMYILVKEPALNDQPKDWEKWRVEHAKKLQTLKPEFNFQIPFIEFPLPK